MMKQYKVKREIMLKLRHCEGAHSAIGGKQRESTNSTATNRTSALKPKECRVADEHRGKKERAMLHGYI